MIDKIIIKKPWGNFEQYCHNQVATVKIHTVLPEQRLSLQYHNHRDEFWKILDGNPLVTIGDKEVVAKAGDEFFITSKTIHRIKAQDLQLRFLEIAFGDFDENDIVRLEDSYGRIA